MLLSTKWVRHLLNRAVHSPATKAFILSLLCWLLSFAFCKARYWRDPHSAFFNSDHVYDLQYSAIRDAQAESLIHAVSQDTKPRNSSDEYEICAAFVTVKREGKNYFEAAVGSMFEGLADVEREKLFLYVLFADMDPTVHPSWDALWLQKLVDSYETYQVDNATLEHLQVLANERNFREKGVFDYVYVLQKCLATGAPYIAIFEDDIIIADGWMAKTRKALRDIKEQAASGKKPWGDWLYLRLFYTETHLFWRAEEDFWYANMWLTFLLASLAGFAMLLGTRFFAPGSRKYLDNFVVATICLLTIPAFTAFAFMIGKNLLVYTHRGVFELEHHGCCTQGLVFPRQQVPDLIKYLEDLKAGQTDMMIEDYADTNGKPKLALEPQVVQHVGLVSSRDGTGAGSQSTWAFWFEGYDPEKLKREHMRLLGS